MLKNFTLITLACFLIGFTNSCTKDVGSLEAGPFSAFTLNGAPGTCTSPVIAGIYSIGRPMNNSNTLTLNINVTVRGKYSIQTNANNNSPRFPFAES